MEQLAPVTLDNVLSVELDEIAQMNILQLAHLQVNIQNLINSQKALTTEYQKRYDFIRNVALPTKMEDSGVESTTLSGIGRISLAAMLNVSVPKANQADFYEWLRENGHGDVISLTANSSTVKALIQEQMRKGEEVPEDLIKINAFTQTRITKA